MENEYKNFIAENTRKIKQYKTEFQSIFNKNIKQYMDVLNGFNIIKFDEEFLHIPNGISIEKYLIEKYGKRANEIIDELIK